MKDYSAKCINAFRIALIEEQKVFIEQKDD